MINTQQFNYLEFNSGFRVLYIFKRRPHENSIFLEHQREHKDLKWSLLLVKVWAQLGPKVLRFWHSLTLT